MLLPDIDIEFLQYSENRPELQENVRGFSEKDYGG
jgi:hypothetical protein